jgi:hypothetical protein
MEVGVAHMSRVAFAKGLFVCLAAVAAQGCNQTSFQSGAEKKPGEQVAPVLQPTQKNIKIPCKDGESKLVTTLSGSSKTSLVVDGEFCGIPGNTETGKLTAFFVLDFSGSMQENDPIEAGSCGRLKAAQAIVAKLESSMKDGIELSAGFLQFGDKALPPFSPEGLDSFKSHLTEAKFCENTRSATNYQAAFDAAKDVLDQVEGHKVIYFISDGMPTVSASSSGNIFTGKIDPKVYADGIKAAESLRKLKDLTLNAVYLGANVGLEGAPASFVPETYLEQITGDKKNVKLATNADALAAEIVKFETPDVSELDTASAKGEVSAAGFTTKTFAVKNLVKDPTKEGVWTFSTDSIDLFASNSKSVANNIKITIKGSDNKTYEALATVTLDTKGK